MIKVMVVDKDPLIGTALAELMGKQARVEVVALAGFDVTAIQAARKYQPGVVVLNIDESFSMSLPLVERLHRSIPGLAVIGLLSRIDHPILCHLLELGIKGLITKNAKIEQLADAVVRVARGDHAIAPDVAQHMAVSSLPGRTLTPFESLTSRELEVACALVDGQRMPAIAKRLNVSPKTVATYKYRIYEKLNIDCEVTLVKLALRHNLVRLEPPVSQTRLF